MRRDFPDASPFLMPITIDAGDPRRLRSGVRGSTPGGSGATDGISLQRYKGLGEMDAERPGETTLDPRSAPSSISPGRLVRGG